MLLHKDSLEKHVLLQRDRPILTSFYSNEFYIVQFGTWPKVIDFTFSFESYKESSSLKDSNLSGS